MSDERTKASMKREEVQSGPLLVGDIVRYLSRLASLHKDARVGNFELSNGLRQLANALRPHAHQPIQGLVDIFRSVPLSNRRESSSRKTKATLPANIESLLTREIDKILSDEKYTKIQIIELGVRRLGIPHSKLARLSKRDALDSIRAALDHEKSLSVISQEARRGGEKRSS